MPPKEDPKLKLAVSEKNSVVTNGSKYESVKSSQAAAKPTDAQKATNPNDPFAPTDSGVETGHGTLPTKEAAASASRTEGPQDVVMEDATVRANDNSARIQELERQLREYKNSNVKLQQLVANYEQSLQAEVQATDAKTVEAQSRITELEVQLSAAMDEVAVLQGT